MHIDDGRLYFFFFFFFFLFVLSKCFLLLMPLESPGPALYGLALCFHNVSVYEIRFERETISAGPATHIGRRKEEER